MTTPKMKLYYHPTFSEEFALNKQRADMFKGNQDVMRQSNYLIPQRLETTHDEGKEAYKQRQQRTFYTNYYKTLVKLNLSYLFRFEPNVAEYIGDSATHLFTEEESRNIDGKNTSLLDFIKAIAEYSIRFPWFFVRVDAPAITPISRGEENAIGMRPYAEIWDPLSVPNWLDDETEFSVTGKLRAVVREKTKVAPRASIFDEPRMQTVREIFEFAQGRGVSRQVWARSNEALSTITRDPQTNKWLVNGGGVEYERVSVTVAPSLDELPIIMSESEPWIDDAMHELMRYHNLLSSHENILYYQAYKRIAVAGEPSDTSGKTLPAAENTVLWLSKDSEVFQIDAEQGEGLRMRCEESKNAAFRLALNQLRQLNAQSKEAPSAESQHADKEDGYIQVKSKMREIEDTVNQFFRLWAKFKAVPLPKSRFQFSDKISSQDLVEFLEYYTATGDAQRKLPTFEVAMLRQLVSFAKTTDLEAKAIQEEIATIAKQAAAEPSPSGVPDPNSPDAGQQPQEAPPQGPPGSPKINGDRFMQGMNNG